MRFKVAPSGGRRHRRHGLTAAAITPTVEENLALSEYRVPPLLRSLEVLKMASLGPHRESDGTRVPRVAGEPLASEIAHV